MVACHLICLLLTLGPANAQTADADAIRLQAEAAFHAGVEQATRAPDDARRCFGCAAASYERLRQAGADNPALYHNLGNAHLLAGDLPEAILAYRRGLRQTPNDRELQRALAFAREQVTYAAASTLGRPPVEHRPPWLPRWPGFLWLVALTGYGVTCFCVARWWMVRRGGLLVIGGIAFALACLVGTGAALEEWQLREAVLHPLVVVAVDDVKVRSGNGFSYPARYDTSLNCGVEARLLYDRGSWLQIELGGGEIGWVPRAAVLID